MGRFNLLDEKWISVTDNNGVSKDVSMLELFENADNYRCISGDMETQNFAVLRMLLAVLMTVFTRVDAHGAPYEFVKLDERMRPTESIDEDDEEDYLNALDQTWIELWNAGKFPKIVSTYLEKWRDRFFLLDEKYPFYQVTKSVLQKNLKVNSKGVLSGSTTMGKQINRLISESGNKTALFSPASEKWKNHMKDADLARWLLMLQGYFGTADKQKPNAYEKVQLSKGWLYDIGGVYLQGNNVFETLMLNLMLHHPEQKQYSLNIQRPCWESDPGEWVENIMRQKPVDNLSSLYTNWCRAVYINPKWTSKEDLSLGLVKLAEIPKEDFFLEPMTLWKKPVKSEHYTPMTLKPAQALWRSFGLVTITNQKTGMKRPEVIDFLFQIKKYLPQGIVSIRSVGMQPDGNATSWLPKDEITDVLQMNEMLIDKDDNGWIIRISDIVDQTKFKIDRIYGSYLENVKVIRDISNSEFTNTEMEKIYAVVDQPFRDWLIGISPDDSKEEKNKEWNSLLDQIILGEARKIQQQFLPRDLIVNNKLGINLPIAFNMLKTALRNQRG